MSDAGITSGKALEARIKEGLAKHMGPAARLNFLLDLYAPEDEDGERHPELGLITIEQLRDLLEMP